MYMKPKCGLNLHLRSKISQKYRLAINCFYTVSGIILTNTCSHITTIASFLYCYVAQSQQVGGTSQTVHQEGQDNMHANQQSGKLV